MIRFLIRLIQERRVKRLKARLRSCGDKVYIHPSVQIADPELVTIGNNCHFQNDSKLFACGGGIEIGDGCIFSHEIQVFARNITMMEKTRSSCHMMSDTFAGKWS